MYSNRGTSQNVYLSPNLIRLPINTCIVLFIWAWHMTITKATGSDTKILSNASSENMQGGGQNEFSLVSRNRNVDLESYE